jgi:hypothetical protein
MKEISPSDKQDPKYPHKNVCPECKSENFIMQQGCQSCVDCGFSKCST